MCEGGFVTGLYLNNKGLNGAMPPVFDRLVWLEYVWFQGNPGLAGPVPEFGRCGRLECVNLSECNVSGTLPTEWDIWHLLYWHEEYNISPDMLKDPGLWQL